MSDPKGVPPAENTPAIAASPAVPSSNGAGVNTSATAPKKPMADGNPAFRMMGLPRFRLPSRNWLIFLSLSGSIASAILYDKYETRRTKQKWCDVVSHLAREPLDTKNMPRKLTIYLAAPPGDGLRSAREHFHNYVKPILVAGAMDWDVVEGRKEGDVRHKTAERVRRKRRRRGEGEALEEEELQKVYAMELMREKNGTGEYPGVSGDLVVGRHMWKEYVRGLHEGWLGPVDEPAVIPAMVEGVAEEIAKHVPGHSSLGDAPAKGVAEAIVASTPTLQPDTDTSTALDADSNSPTTLETPTPSETLPSEDVPKEEEKPSKPRNPPPYLLPSAYPMSTLSPSIPEVIGPSIILPFPHILGVRNTHIRIYRFLTRRRLADEIGRDVAAAVLGASYRSFDTVTARTGAEESGTGDSVPEQKQVLANEEKEWWKSVHRARDEGEESVWIEGMALDERVAGRMRRFELSALEEDRAKRIAAGTEVVVKETAEE
ncbi:mitochondrial import inner membrane translocase subunit tim54 [Friedmanniomyces endolithicus]|nr:mitochondrial import inner membrane translocase subunit tim54 [Friedmanniomyces endolithicus]